MCGGRYWIAVFKSSCKDQKGRIYIHIYFSCDQAALWSHRTKKNHRFWPELSVSGLLLQFEYYPWLWNDAQSLMYYRRGALLFSQVIHQISRSHGTKKSPILTRIERFRTVTPVWVTDGFKMMHKAWDSMQEVPYCFSRSSTNIKVTRAEKSTIWIQFE